MWWASREEEGVEGAESERWAAASTRNLSQRCRSVLYPEGEGQGQVKMWVSERLLGP